MKTSSLKINFSYTLLLSVCLLQMAAAPAQKSLLLNGGFEDVNTCVEYNAECGVEGWFYLRDVKAQMLSNGAGQEWLGSNSFALSFNWLGYTAFAPLVGTILPCHFQKDRRYTLSGIIKASFNGKLIMKPGIAMGEKFYVPNKAFSASMRPDSITQLTETEHPNFFRFEYSFMATGKEKYVTFGTFIQEDKTGARQKLAGAQTISILLDNFEILSSDSNEVACDDYRKNERVIYNYNYRHKEMDYSLYGKGELAVKLQQSDSGSYTRIQIPVVSLPPVIDTLQLGDVFFDFNKTQLKPTANSMLDRFFESSGEKTPNSSIDSIYIEGHTDSIGSDAANMELSRQRCESLRTWLLQHNVIPNDRIYIHPFGRSRPVASNNTPAGRALNRRVELVVFRKSSL